MPAMALVITDCQTRNILSDHFWSLRVLLLSILFLMPLVSLALQQQPLSTHTTQYNQKVTQQHPGQASTTCPMVFFVFLFFHGVVLLQNAVISTCQTFHPLVCILPRCAQAQGNFSWQFLVFIYLQVPTRSYYSTIMNKTWREKRSKSSYFVLIMSLQDSLTRRHLLNTP